MSLQARTYFVAALSVLIGLVLSALIVWWSGRSDTLKQELDLLSHIRSGAADLRTATFEYVPYREERPRMQAQQLLPKLRGHLDELAGWSDYQGPRQRELWTAAYANLTEYEDLLNQVVTWRRDRRTVGLLLSRSHSMVNAIEALAQPLRDAERRMRTFGMMVVIASLGAMTGLPLVAAGLLRRFVLGPVARLGGAVAAVRAGNLDLRLRATSPDEFGKLARAFDTMLDRLQEFTVSRERLEAEMAERRASELKYRRLHASLRDAFASIDITGRLVEWNPTFREMIGYDNAELSGLTLTDLTPAGWHDMEDRIIREQVLPRGHSEVYQKEFRHKDGHTFPVELRTFLVSDEEGQPVGMSALVRDITERYRAEAELALYRKHLEELVEVRAGEIVRANESLAAANKELEAFSYSVSHDLRVPLRAIDGFSRILLEDYHDKLDAEGQRLLNVVRDSTTRMAQLIDDILRFSRAGRIEISPVVIDMTGLARAVLDEMRPTFEGRALSIDIKPLPTAKGDRAMLRQVFANLLSNAIKFTAPKKGATVVVDGFREGGESVYRIKDDGVGFDPRFADKLFGMFQRLHPVEEFEGTGIGLALVKRIVGRHGGRVCAEGKVNVGATFCFALPNQETAP